MNDTSSKILIGWKKIAAYLECSLSSARRLADRGLPIFRVGGSVRAYAAEIDRWLRQENAHLLSQTASSDNDPGNDVGRNLEEIITAFSYERDGRRFTVVPSGITAAELERIASYSKSSGEQHRDLLDKVPVWIWEMDVRGVFTYSNAVASKVLGYHPIEIVGHSASELGIVPDDLPLFERSIEILKQEGKAIKYLECRFVCPAGELRRLEIYAAPVFDANGNFSGIRGVGCDITGRKSRREALP